MIYKTEQMPSNTTAVASRRRRAAISRYPSPPHPRKPGQRATLTHGRVTYQPRYHILYIRDLYIMTSIESIAVPVRLFSIFNISLRALDVLFIALSGSAILRDSIRQSYWDACVRFSSGRRRAGGRAVGRPSRATPTP